MPRQTIALLIALYAIAFAFGAMAAIRWPSLMMVAAFMLEGDATQGLPNIDWRELGIAYGAPYFLSALCLYASAMMVSQRRRGSVLWYLMGCVSGFPCVFLVDFESGWWRDPGIWEGAVAGGASGAVLLGIAVWLLRGRNQATEKTDPVSDVNAEAPETAKVIVAATPKPKRRRQVAPAIARQRAHFAAQGRRMRERERARLKLP